MLQHHASPPRTARRGRAGGLRAAGSWLVFAAMLALAVFLWPHQWGGHTSLTIVSGHSMDGTFATGDLIIGRTGTAEVGDVIVFRPPGLDGYVVHRIVGGDADTGWVTQGDNNDWLDPWNPTSDDVIGIVHWRIPQAWVLVKFATSPFAIATYALIVVGVFLWPNRCTSQVRSNQSDIDQSDSESTGDPTAADAKAPAPYHDGGRQPTRP